MSDLMQCMLMTVCQRHLGNRKQAGLRSPYCLSVCRRVRIDINIAYPNSLSKHVDDARSLKWRTLVSLAVNKNKRALIFETNQTVGRKNLKAPSRHTYTYAYIHHGKRQMSEMR